jgi:hypothetical protein
LGYDICIEDFENKDRFFTEPKQSSSMKLT